jgi:predicted aspartyl protease
MRAVTSRLPVTWINGLPFIDVEVNGRKGKALVDTGASNTFINSAFAKKAARSAKDYSQIEVISSTGIVTPLRVLSSRRFTVGDFKVTRFDVIVLDPAFLASCGLQDEPVMVMGLDILRQFRMQLDRESHEIRLSQPNPLMRPGSKVYFNGN